MKNKKVIFFVPDLDINGCGRAVSELSLNLPDYIERIIVLFKNEISYPYKGRLITLNLLIPNNFFSKIYHLFIGVLRLKKIIKIEKPDYIISSSEHTNIINVLSNKKSNKRMILRIGSVTSESYSGGTGLIYKIFVRLLFGRSFQIISVSKRIADDLIKNFGIKKEKIKVIYNALDIKKIQDLVQQPLEPKYQEIFKNPVIINIGRITEIKGQWRLIKAFREVKNKVKESKLVILGKGGLEKQLKKLIKDLNLENDVYLLGCQKNPFKFLAKSKVFVLSSLYEGLPNVILEAMACGLPIISANCKSGPREILAPDTNIYNQTQDIEYADYGILTPAFDGKFYGAKDPLTKSEKKLSKAMIEVLTNEDLSDSLIEKSRQRAEDFNVKKIIKEWDFLNK